MVWQVYLATASILKKVLPIITCLGLEKAVTVLWGWTSYTFFYRMCTAKKCVSFSYMNLAVRLKAPLTVGHVMSAPICHKMPMFPLYRANPGNTITMWIVPLKALFV